MASELDKLLLGLVFCATSSAQTGFAPWHRLPLTPPITKVHARDLNGDGADDLVVATAMGLEVRYSDGTGRFSSYPAVVLPFGGLSSAGFGDLDRDGDLDLVVSNPGSLTFVENLGGGRFRGGVTSPRNGRSFGWLELGDFDRDGWPDAALIEPGTWNLDIAFGNGAGYFPSMLSIPLPGQVIHPPRLVDMRADGSPEIIQEYTGGTVVVSVSTLRQPLIAPVPTSTGTGGGVLAVLDMNGDGLEDLVRMRSGVFPLPDHLTATLQDGVGGFQPEFVLHVLNTSSPQLIVGHFDGGRDEDLVILDSDTSTYLLREGSQATRLTRNEGPIEPFATAGDFDLDGDTDLVDFAFSALTTYEQRARYSLHLSFDEPAGHITYDRSRGNLDTFALEVRGTNRWQADPGLGRDIYRGADPGSGVLSHGGWLPVGPPGQGLPSQSGSFTVTWWQRRTSVTPVGDAKFFRGAGIQAHHEVASGSNLVLTAGNAMIRSTRSITTPGVWVHVAIVVDLQRNLFELWLDGNPEGSAPLPTGFSSRFDMFDFGAGPLGHDPATRDFDLDEFHYVPRALTRAEILRTAAHEDASVAVIGGGCFEHGANEGLLVEGTPRAGELLRVRVETGSALGPKILVAGLSATGLAGLPLPFDLTPGCPLRVSTDVVIPLTSSELEFRLPSPFVTPIENVYLQAIVLDAGVRTTRAWDLRIAP